MPFNLEKLALQSWSLRNIPDPVQMAAGVRELGLKAVEVSSAHVKPADEESVQRVIDACRENGVDIVAIGAGWFKRSPPTPRQIMEFAHKAGASVIGVQFRSEMMWDGIREAEELAEEFDVKLAIHNHGGKHWLGNPEILQYIFAKTGPRVGLLLDTAWMLDAGGDPLKAARQFGERLYGLHLKDFLFKPNRDHEERVLGEGNLDLKALFDTLTDIGFAGTISIEYEADADNPMPALMACVANVRAAAAQ